MMAARAVFLLFAVAGCTAAGGHGQGPNTCMKSATLALGSVTEHPNPARAAQLGKGVTIAQVENGVLSTLFVIPKTITGPSPSYCAFTEGSLYCGNLVENATVTRIYDVDGSQDPVANSTSMPTGGAAVSTVAVMETRCKSTDIILASNFGRSNVPASRNNAVTSFVRRRSAPDSEPWKRGIHRTPAKYGTSPIGRPAPHQILPIGHREFLVPDLGSDKVWRLKVNRFTAKLKVVDKVDLPGEGPRHGVMHKRSRMMYIANQNTNTVARLSINGCGKGLAVCEIVELLPGVALTAKDSAAAIRISSDQRFLYVSGGLTSADGSKDGRIVGFELNADGTIAGRVGDWSTHGNHPRDFDIIGPTVDATGACVEYVAVANRNTDNLVLLERDTTTGELATTPSSIMTTKRPTSVLPIPSPQW